MTSAVTGSRALEKPLPSEIDVYGLTHRGHVRSENADHFLIASFHRAMHVHASSIPASAFASHSADSRGYVFLVADGVGAFAQAANGSARAIRSVAQCLVDMSEVSLPSDPAREEEVVNRIRAAFAEAHETLLQLDERGEPGSAITTLTMLIAIWPRAFIVHAGDSRAYRLRQGILTRLTTDQTMAQAMIDAGAMTRDSAEASPLKHVLLSALGSAQVDPQVLVQNLERQDVMLLCTDGLTKHVGDDEIHEHMSRPVSSESICGTLIDLALERGGEDNVTVVVGKARIL
ncbi:MAG TPA: protein phosphatase 2C domain-containing protein [Gemmatimonadaceae bacterium]|nr:protein phosphatase 2C domain-containing protein [Gemmatimonadaceae bacterium]